MNGHLSMGATRRLNRHYQSQNIHKKHTGVKITFGAGNWRYYAAMAPSVIPVGDFFDVHRTVRLGGLIDTGIIIRNGDITLNFSPLRDLNSRPVIKIIYDFAKIPDFLRDKNIYLSLFGSRLSTGTEGTQLSNNNVFSAEGNAPDSWRPPIENANQAVLNDDIFSPQVLSEKAFDTIQTRAVSYDYGGILEGWKSRYLPVYGRGVKINEGEKIIIYVVQDYSAEDIINYDSVITCIHRLCLLTDYKDTRISDGVDYNWNTLREMGYSPSEVGAGVWIFTEEERAILNEQSFEVWIDAKKCSPSEIENAFAHYPLTDFYNML